MRMSTGILMVRDMMHLQRQIAFGRPDTTCDVTRIYHARSISYNVSQSGECGPVS